jgi:hypothetical protein
VRCATLVPGRQTTTVVGERVPRTDQAVAVVAAAAIASGGLYGRHGIACCPDRIKLAGFAAGIATYSRHPEVARACVHGRKGRARRTIGEDERERERWKGGEQTRLRDRSRLRFLVRKKDEKREPKMHK